MNLFNTTKDAISTLIHGAWWIEVTTHEPDCIYYFGPFDTLEEAELSCAGYVQDLTAEGAQGISTLVKRCHPKAMTIEGANRQ